MFGVGRLSTKRVVVLLWHNSWGRRDHRHQTSNCAFVTMRYSTSGKHLNNSSAQVVQVPAVTIKFVVTSLSSLLRTRVGKYRVRIIAVQFARLSLFVFRDIVSSLPRCCPDSISIYILQVMQNVVSVLLLSLCIHAVICAACRVLCTSVEARRGRLP